MSNRFKILFSSEIQHEYYSSLPPADFKIIPSAETLQCLKDFKMMYKLVNNQLLVLIKVNDSGADIDKPLVTPGKALKLVFYLELLRPVFMNVTNLDFDRICQQKFYFSNNYRNKKATSLYLSKPISSYNSAQTYVPGMMVTNGSGTVFECIQKTPDAASVAHAPGDDAFWKSRGAFEYASGTDLVTVVNKITNFQVTTAATVFTVAAFTVNPSNGLDYDIAVPLNKDKAISFNDTEDPAIKNVQVDLSELLPGKYRIQVNDTSFHVYVDEHAAGYFGILEIFNHVDGSEEFSLLDAAAKVKDTIIAGRPPWLSFVIRFPNRYAFRKFVSTRKGIDSIIADLPEYSFATVPFPPPPLPSIPADIFISNKPVPMYDKQAIFKLVLKTPITSDPLKAPNANPDIPGMLTRFGNDFYCTVYLNY
jgi:hypothetical protein